MDINTLFVGKVTHYFSELSSTNAYAVEWLSKTKPREGTAIIAGHQTAGRGQIGRSWHDSAGKNLLLSVVFYPHWLAVSAQFGLSQAVALAVADTVRPYKPAQVKWPNDVYIGDAKVAGILIQNSLQGSQIQWSVVGIGLNVNEEAFPSELSRATSLQQICGYSVALDDVQSQLFHHLERRYLQLKSHPDRTAADYLAHLYRYEQWHTYIRTEDGQPFMGKIIGTDESGRLAILLDNQTVQHFDVKAVAFGDSV